MSGIMQLRALICVVLLVGARAAEEVSLPSSIKVSNCNHDSPDYADCFKTALQESLPAIINGIPELGSPVLDPLKLDLVESVYQFGLLKSHSVSRNVKIYGFGNTIIQAVRPSRSANRMSLEVDYAVPNVFVEGNYKVDGDVGSLKISGKGYFNSSSEGNRGTVGLEGRIENDRWVLEHVHINYPDNTEIKKLTVYFDDLFNGNKELNKAALTFINDFWPMLYKDMLPLVEKLWDSRTTDLLNRLVFSKLSFAKTFP